MSAGAEAPPPRVGLVVVSHSEPLARAAVALATEMVAEDPPAMVIAAGTTDGGTGTDATAVASAIEEADAGAGVVAVLDLGSAIMSAEMALEFLSGDHDVRLVPAPFVEGLVAAAVRAAAGAGIDEVVREAADALGPKIAQLGGHGVEGAGADGDGRGDPEGQGAPPTDGTPDAERTAVVVNAAGLHARPAAAIAAAVGRLDARVWVGVRGTWADASSPTSLAVLTAAAGTELDLVAQGPQARVGVDAVAALVKSGFGEAMASADSEEGPATEGEADPNSDSPVIPSAAGTAPVGVSAGRAEGPVWQSAAPPDEPAKRLVPESERAAQADRIGPACAEVSRALRDLGARVTGDSAAIMEATAAIAADPALRKRASKLCEEGRDAERAIWEAAGSLAQSLHAAGGVIAERATDVRDVRDRVISVLAGRNPAAPRATEAHVLVAADLAPADAVELDPAICLAIVTERGAPGSHTAIIARQLGIPAVVGARGATSIPPGTTVVVDGDTGEFVVEPAQSQPR